MDFKKMKIEKIEGGASYSDIFDFQDKMKALSQILQKDLYAVVRKIDSDASLEFDFRKADTKDPQVVAICKTFSFMFQVDKDTMAFRFDDVRDYNRIVPPLLTICYNTIVKFFNIKLILRSGMEFTNIFDLKQDCDNIDFFAEQLFPQIRAKDSVFAHLIKKRKIHRTDFHISFDYNNTNIFLRIEAPANDENTTVWCSVDVRNKSAKLKKEELLDFDLPYLYYTNEYAGFLRKIFDIEKLNLQKRELFKP
jgi:hypothetical protein